MIQGTAEGTAEGEVQVETLGIKGGKGGKGGKTHALQPGDQAPSFALQDQVGETLTFPGQ